MVVAAADELAADEASESTLVSEMFEVDVDESIN